MKIKKFYNTFKPSINYILLMFVIQLILSFISMMGLYMEEYPSIQFIFSLLIIITYVMMGIVFGRSAASSDYKKTRILETRKRNGEILTRADKMSGYSNYKGYILGLISAFPLFLLLLICVPMGDDVIDLAATIRIMYFMFYLPIGSITTSIHIAVLFYAIPANALIMGLFYNLYGIRLIKQREIIQQEAKKNKSNFSQLQQHIHKSEMVDKAEEIEEKNTETKVTVEETALKNSDESHLVD